MEWCGGDEYGGDEEKDEKEEVESVWSVVVLVFFLLCGYFGLFVDVYGYVWCNCEWFDVFCYDYYLGLVY